MFELSLEEVTVYQLNVGFYRVSRSIELLKTPKDKQYPPARS